MSVSLDGISDAALIAAWRRRGIDLWAAMASELSAYVGAAAIEALLTALIHEDNPACHDRSNAAHVMAQNDNLVILASGAGLPGEALAIALAAGLVHDLNKAADEPLRQDELGVRTADGQPVDRLRAAAEVVGLNHYGERTRRAFDALVGDGLLDEASARQIDRCVVHHGLGSSRFIRGLVRGELGFGRDDFVAPDGRPRLRLPPQPRPTLATVLHDLADSAQQMQAGSAWVSKYPLGYWRESGASWRQLLSGDVDTFDMPVGLIGQLEVELATCQDILREGVAAEVLHRGMALRLERGVHALIDAGRAWADDDPETLALPHGGTVYHQLAQAQGGTAADAHARLSELRPGDDPNLDARLLRGAHALDDARARQLHVAVARRMGGAPA